MRHAAEFKARAVGVLPLGTPVLVPIGRVAAVLAALFVGLAGPGVRAQVPLLELTGDEPFGGFGSALAALGDLDGDGLPEVAVGLPFGEFAGDYVGRVRVLSGADGHELFSLHGAQRSELFGWSVAAAGDTNGDGTADVLVGAPNANGFSGRALLVSGANGAILHEWQGQPGDRFGYALGSAGDRNGDGVADVFVSAWGVDADVLTPEVGAVSILDPVDGALLSKLQGGPAYGHFGSAVAVPGDGDLDGLPDLAVGSITEDVAELCQPGVVRWFAGSGNGVLHVFVGANSYDEYGGALAAAGDLDGDGIGDLCVGIPGSNQGGASAGRVVVVSGPSGGELLVIPGEPLGELGRAVAGVGDLDADGVPDLLLGAPNSGVVLFSEGTVRAVSGADGHELFRLTGGQEDAGCGAAVAAAGDLDGNGVPDVLVGVPGLDGAVQGEGLVLVLSGSSWSQLGAGVGGSTGVPKFGVVGDPTPGKPLELGLHAAPPGAPAVLVVGLSQLDAPFKGGTLVPFPDFLSPALSVGASGDLVLGGNWPALAPEGFTVYFQWWVADAGAPSGFSSTPGVEIVTL